MAVFTGAEETLYFCTPHLRFVLGYSKAACDALGTAAPFIY